MAPTLHNIPLTSAELRRTGKRLAPRVRTRMTFAESPELYLREEMA
jgi:hypothetical protein